MTQQFELTIEDIAEVAQSLNYHFDDPNRRDALLCTTSRDIQACPGSGKTTLLVAKLAILAKKWPWRDRGICVLSHTNVARQEVESRLQNNQSAQTLLGYPHFIGTIQVFIDQFLALPYLRERGIDVCAVDDERFQARVQQLMNKYYYAKTYVERKSHTAGPAVASLRFEGPSLQLGSGGGKLPGPKTPTYEALKNLKRRIGEEGIFRFDDMYAFAEAYLEKNRWVAEALRQRFPWIFVDEMQDTEEKQDKLITHIFGDRCVVQRLGDLNQAIFRDQNDSEYRTSFPVTGFIGLPESRRFGQAIASLASPFTAQIRQNLIGNPDVPERSHTIFLFDEETVKKVLPAFGDLLAQEYSSGLPQNFVAKAIGARKKGTEEAGKNQIPYSIGDYWENFQPFAVSKSLRPNYLIDFVQRAQDTCKRDGECKKAYDWLVDGVVGYLQRQAAMDSSGARFTRTRLTHTLEETPDIKSRFQSMLLSWCLSEKVLGQESWKDTCDAVVELFARWSGGSLTQEAKEYLAWSNQANESKEGTESAPTSLLNTYHHDCPIGTINIELTTIHAAKGETHTATLILETCWYKHDFEDLLPFLLNSSTARPKKTSRTDTRMKLIFVAMTRPRELLCLAMHRTRLDDKDIAVLLSKGWKIQDVLSAQSSANVNG